MKTPMQRFEEKYEPEPMSGCWLWTAATVNGYGRFGVSGAQKSVLAYRWLYEQMIGPVPPGKELDHLCRNRLCVNPAHLEPVTRAENDRRSPLTNSGKEACWRGHLFTPENTYQRKDRPGRLCRACHNEKMRLGRAGEAQPLKPRKEAPEIKPKKTQLGRFEEKIERDEVSGCWVWVGAIAQATGYGVFTPGKGQRWQLAHRMSYELFVGPIPKGLVIHHQCGRRDCVNPQHLEATTQRGNLMATPETQAATNIAKVVCIRGHQRWTTLPSGRRACMECNRLRQRAYRSHKGA